jgi:phosphoribosyl 1,2-cyclic phosphodiesterase/ActR/RegA family two-component response regulator
MPDTKSLSFYVVEDDETVVDLIKACLEAAGHKVQTASRAGEALSEIERSRPDCVLTDIMMPDMDGLEICRTIKHNPALAATKVIVVSAKAYEFDRKRAVSFGADGFITKPITPETFTDRLTKLIDDKIDMTFWGVRGTLPVPGPGSLRYGGNTNCVTLEFPTGPFFIFDAGTGIKALSDNLLKSGRTRLEFKVFISHPHWDHINGLPFFVPAYIPGNELEICGASHGDTSVRQLVSAQMDDIYFPVTIKEFGARVFFRDLREETLQFESVTVKTMLLIHPGYCLGYRVEYRGRSICYITDNEFYLPESKAYDRHNVDRLRRFVEGTDALITDCTYTDQEYKTKVGWGHSAMGQVVDFAHSAGVKKLYLYHHDPSQDDNAIDAKQRFAEERFKELGSATGSEAPAEGKVYRI